MKNTILIVCTITNVIVTLIALIFVFKVDVTWTGPLGDTFGGLLSPLIGGISIYFIYKTFEAQREQLEDQKKSNEETIAIQRKQLEDQKNVNDEMIATQREQLTDQVSANRVTMGALHLEKIDRFIDDIKKQNEQFYYVSSDFQELRGDSAVIAFRNNHNSFNVSLYKHISDQDSGLINKLLVQAEQVSFVVSLFNELKKDLTEEYILMAESKINSLISVLNPNFSRIYKLLLEEIQQVRYTAPLKLDHFIE